MRRAFVCGARGPASLSPPLKYVENDVESFISVISTGRCRYNVFNLSVHSEAQALRQALLENIENCDVGDEIIWYFAGHGKLLEGSLYLVLNDSDMAKPRSTCLPVREIVETLQSCKASTKIVILDCCHAGGAVAGVGFRDIEETSERLVTALHSSDSFSDGLVVLCASDALERAREIDDLKHGFLTHTLCDALTNDFRKAAGRETRLTMNALLPYLSGKAKRHNKNHPSAKVPIPVCYGKQRDGIYLTADPYQFFPHLVPWCHGYTMALLPVKPVNGKAFLIGTSLVSNRLFSSICHPERPVPPWGADVNDGPSCHDPRQPGTSTGRLLTSGPRLHPLSIGSGYSDPDQPAVAWNDYTLAEFVRLFDEQCGIPSHRHEARRNYLEWIDVSRRATKAQNSIAERFRRIMWDENHRRSPWSVPDHHNMLPSKQLWDAAAIEDEVQDFEPLRCLCKCGEATTLVPESTVGDENANWLGLAQMFGNVWQICIPFGDDDVVVKKGNRRYPDWNQPLELCGGSFLERASATPPGINAGRWRVYLSKNEYFPAEEHWVKGIMHRCDVGVRLAAMMPVSELPAEISDALDACPPYRGFQ